MRNTFSNLITQAAQQDPHTYLLTGDHGYALFDQFRKTCPQQFINAGVAEQNMIGVGAGLAKSGIYPMIYGLSAFVPVRVLEQIKMDFCYEELPGLFIGDGAGVVYSALGSSHQSFEDIASLRGIPHLVIMSPADKFELEACFSLARSLKKPVYLRLGKADLPAIHQAIPAIKLNELLSVHQKPGNKKAIIATGSMLSVANKLISTELSNYDLWSAPIIKPLNRKKVLEQLKSYENLVSLEEHSVYGGLGSCLAEIIASQGTQKLQIIGIEDKFSELCGSYEYLMKTHALDETSVLQRIRDLSK